MLTPHSIRLTQAKGRQANTQRKLAHFSRIVNLHLSKASPSLASVASLSPSPFTEKIELKREPFSMEWNVATGHCPLSPTPFSVSSKAITCHSSNTGLHKDTPTSPFITNLLKLLEEPTYCNLLTHQEKEEVRKQLMEKMSEDRHQFVKPIDLSTLHLLEKLSLEVQRRPKQEGHAGVQGLQAFISSSYLELFQREPLGSKRSSLSPLLRLNGWLEKNLYHWNSRATLFQPESTRPPQKRQADLTTIHQHNQRLLSAQLFRQVDVGAALASSSEQKLQAAQDLPDLHLELQVGPYCQTHGLNNYLGVSWISTAQVAEAVAHFPGSYGKVIGAMTAHPTPQNFGPMCDLLRQRFKEFLDRTALYSEAVYQPIKSLLSLSTITIGPKNRHEIANFYSRYPHKKIAQAAKVLEDSEIDRIIVESKEMNGLSFGHYHVLRRVDLNGKKSWISLDSADNLPQIVNLQPFLKNALAKGGALHFPKTPQTERDLILLTQAPAASEQIERSYASTDLKLSALNSLRKMISSFERLASMGSKERLGLEAEEVRLFLERCNNNLLKLLPFKSLLSEHTTFWRKRAIQACASSGILSWIGSDSQPLPENCLPELTAAYRALQPLLSPATKRTEGSSDKAAYLEIATTLKRLTDQSLHFEYQEADRLNAEQFKRLIKKAEKKAPAWLLEVEQCFLQKAAPSPKILEEVNSWLEKNFTHEGWHIQLKKSPLKGLALVSSFKNHLLFNIES